MLTALEIANGVRLALPDVRSRAGLEAVRGRARSGELVCPACRQLLWLHAGVKRIAYFAHRKLNDCPQARVSEAVLTARSLLYRFFQERIEQGKLAGTLELEPTPVFSEPAASAHPLDLLLSRADALPVAVVLLESGLKPEARAELPWQLDQARMIFRPVFLLSRLKHPAHDARLFLLDTTQREFQQDSPYGVARDWQDSAATLRFIDPDNAKWLSLRSLALVESPQVYRAAVRESPLNQMLWSQAHSEWVHPGEAEALKSRRERQAIAQAKPPPPQPARTPPPPTVVASPDARAEVPPDDPWEERPTETLPAWLKGGLRCVGCSVRTNDWQNADPANDVCVCRACFKGGVRLP